MATNTNPRSTPGAHLRRDPRHPPPHGDGAESDRCGRCVPALLRFLLAALCLRAPARAQSVEWTQRTVSGPSARYGHALAYDAAHGSTVLFGGYTSALLNSETWDWNGAAWTQRMVAGPSPRYQHAMAYDAGRGVTVLFGGRDEFTSKPT